jgi:hypothetical protein
MNTEYRNPTTEELRHIRQLVENSLSAPNKQIAKDYLSELNFISLSGLTGANPYLRNVLSELVGFVSVATGKVSDKESKVSTAKQLLIKFEMLSKREHEK